MGRVSEEAGFVLGRIGFHRTVRGGGWDDETQDFVSVDREDVVIAPFAIQLATLRVAFQTRGSEIKPQSFVGAFQALLDQASPVERWRVRHETSAETFPVWLARVKRVERVHVRVQRPNPNYRGRKQVEEIVEGLNAKAAELTAKADPQDPKGLDLAGTLLQELVGHAEKYGSYDAAGTDAEGTRVEWHSQRRAGEIDTELDPETGVASPSALTQALEDDGEDDPAEG